MFETGRIREINGNSVIVVPEKGVGCFGCMNQECRAHGGISAENSLSLPLETGQTVEVGAPGVSLLAQALAALLPPLLGFGAGYALACILFPKAGEGAFAGMGVVFLFLTAFIVYKIRSRFPAAREYTVTRIL